jgi:hypothetical protein
MAAQLARAFLDEEPWRAEEDGKIDEARCSAHLPE